MDDWTRSNTCISCSLLLCYSWSIFKLWIGCSCVCQFDRCRLADKDQYYWLNQCSKDGPLHSFLYRPFFFLPHVVLFSSWLKMPAHLPFWIILGGTLVLCVCHSFVLFYCYHFVTSFSCLLSYILFNNLQVLEYWVARGMLQILYVLYYRLILFYFVPWSFNFFFF